MTRTADTIIRPPTRPCRAGRVPCASAAATLDITVLAGGPSDEHEVSLASGRAVHDALVRLGHRVTMRDIAPNELSALDVPADCTFIALHGAFGEDGQVQGIMDRAGKQYCGSDATSSALAMDKVEAKRCFVAHGVPTPRFEVADGAALEAIAASWQTPVVVKPIRSGSSVDTYIVREPGGSADALRAVVGTHGDALIEQYIDGLELTVGMLDGRPLPPLQIRTKREFYDYQAKYVDDDTEYLFDIDLPDEVLKELQRLSVRAQAALACRDFCRVDWMVDRRTHTPFVLEINTIPGFTSHSLLPKAAARVGVSFEELCQRIVMMAMRRV